MNGIILLDAVHDATAERRSFRIAAAERDVILAVRRVDDAQLSVVRVRHVDLQRAVVEQLVLVLHRLLAEMVDTPLNVFERR